jgi:vacuolar-type H+-ATPase subunit B/Vma2
VGILYREFGSSLLVMWFKSVILILDTRKISMLKQVTEVDRLIEQVAELHWELMELQDKQTKQELVAGGATWTEALP